MLELCNVSKQFRHNVALDNVSIRLGTGVYGLLGPNGSGKTTLIRCITGVISPTSGEIHKPENIGYLPQKFGMFKELTAFETLEYFAALKGVPRNAQKNTIMECLEQVHLANRATDKIGSLSGGMVRRIGIAQTLLGNPSMIILDEPTAGLDPEERLRFKNLVSKLRNDYTILISTHIVEDVEAVCDNIIILHKGSILTQGTAQDLRQHAAGKVYTIPADKRNTLCEPYFVLREEYIGDVLNLRILSNCIQDCEICRPTVEDGYMLYIRDNA